MAKKTCIVILLIQITTIFAIDYDISKEKSLNQSKVVTGFEPSHATDGNLNTYVKVSYLEDSTHYFKGVWIQVDLDGLYKITKIYLWTTDDDDYYLASNIIIYIKRRNNYNYDTGIEFPLDPNYRLNLNKKSSINYSYTNGIFGKYVWFGKKHEIMENFCFAEFVIISEFPYVGINSILNITQNNDFDSNTIADYAIDGNINTCSYTAQQNGNLRNIKGLLKIDLGKNYDINELQIYDTNSINAFSGFYQIYIDSSSTHRNLWFDYNQISIMDSEYYIINLNRSTNGRYVTFVKNSLNRIDALLFCEIRILISSSAKTLIYPVNYSTTTLYSITYNPSTPVIKASTPFTNYTINYAAETTGIIVGCIVGVFGAIILAILIFLIYKKCKNKSFEKPKILNSINRKSNVFFHRKRSSRLDHFEIDNPVENVYDTDNTIIAGLRKTRENALSEFKKITK